MKWPLFLVFFSINGFAQTAEVSSSSVEFSSVEVSGQLTSEDHWLKIKVIKKPDGVLTSSWIFPVTDLKFSKTVFLKHGPGEYEIWVERSKNEKRQGIYSVFKHLTVMNRDVKDRSFLLPSEQIESDQPDIVSLAYKLSNAKTEHRAKSKAIFDWVVANIHYDYATYGSKEHPTLRYYSSLETLNGKTAECNGFAHLIAALHRAIGMKAKVMHGDLYYTIVEKTGNVTTTTKKYAGRHTWNEVYIDDRWVPMDATLDAINNAQMKVQKEANPNLEFPTVISYFDPDPSIYNSDHVNPSEED